MKKKVQDVIKRNGLSRDKISTGLDKRGEHMNERTDNKRHYGFEHTRSSSLGNSTKLFFDKRSHAQISATDNSLMEPSRYL